MVRGVHKPELVQNSKFNLPRAFFIKNKQKGLAFFPPEDSLGRIQRYVVPDMGLQGRFSSTAMI